MKEVLIPGFSIAHKVSAGEDAVYHKKQGNCICLGVFDGCGSLGSQRYPRFGDHTGAYIGAKVAQRTLGAWFEEFDGKLDSEIFEKICNDTRNLFYDRLNAYWGKVKEESPLKPGRQKAFPTTAAYCVCAVEENRCRLGFCSAGDSRGYVLTKTGLVQITRDDTAVADAFDSLGKSQDLHNILCAEQDFEINGAYLELTEPFIFFVATDGCFKKFKTPMHFEYYLLKSLAAAENMKGWGEGIKQYFLDYADDDCSMELRACGYFRFSEIQEAMAAREQALWKHFISPLEENEFADARVLWADYKERYYREDF